MGSFRTTVDSVVKSLPSDMVTAAQAPAQAVAPITMAELQQAFALAQARHADPAAAQQAGLAGVLELLAEAGQRRAAMQIERYDHRSLYAFAAELRYAARNSSSSS